MWSSTTPTVDRVWSRLTARFARCSTHLAVGGRCGRGRRRGHRVWSRLIARFLLLELAARRPSGWGPVWSRPTPRSPRAVSTDRSLRSLLDHTSGWGARRSRPTPRSPCVVSTDRSLRSRPRPPSGWGPAWSRPTPRSPSVWSLTDPLASPRPPLDHLAWGPVRSRPTPRSPCVVSTDRLASLAARRPQRSGARAGRGHAAVTVCGLDDRSLRSPLDDTKRSGPGAVEADAAVTVCGLD